MCTEVPTIYQAFSYEKNCSFLEFESFMLMKRNG